jgi:hypothetical protein
VIWFCTVGWTAGAGSAAAGVPVSTTVPSVETLVVAVDFVLLDDVGATGVVELVLSVVEESAGGEVRVEGGAVLDPVGVRVVGVPAVDVGAEVELAGAGDVGEVGDVGVVGPVVGAEVVGSSVVGVAGVVLSSVVGSLPLGVDSGVDGAELVGSLAVVDSVGSAEDAPVDPSDAAPSACGLSMVATEEVVPASLPVSANATEAPPNTRAVLSASTRIGRIADRSRERAVTDMRL